MVGKVLNQVSDVLGAARIGEKPIRAEAVGQGNLGDLSRTDENNDKNMSKLRLSAQPPHYVKAAFPGHMEMQDKNGRKRITRAVGEGGIALQVSLGSGDVLRYADRHLDPRASQGALEDQRLLVMICDQENAVWTLGTSRCRKDVGGRTDPPALPRNRFQPWALPIWPAKVHLTACRKVAES